MSYPRCKFLPHRPWTLLGLLAAVACHSPPQSPADTYRVYPTSVAVADCIELDDESRRSDPVFRLGAAVFRCPGPEPYAIFIVDDGTRSWYVLDRRGTRQSLEQDIVYRDAVGDFANVGARGSIEWLLDPQNHPAGLVFAIHYQGAQVNDKGFRVLERYMSYALTDHGAVPISLERTIARARNSLTRHLRSR